MRGDQSFRVTEQIFSDTTDGREFLCVRRERKKWNVFEMGKGKLQIKEEISLLRIASGADPSMPFVLSTLHWVDSWRPPCSLAADQSRFYPSENQTPMEWKVLFSSVCLTCVLFVLKMDTFLLTAFFLRWHFSFHPQREKNSVENNNTQLYSNWLISDPSLSHFENTILDDIFLLLGLSEVSNNRWNLEMRSIIICLLN